MSPYSLSQESTMHRSPALLPALSLACALALFAGTAAQAHEGHEHADAPVAAAPQASRPRANAVSESFELVAELSGRQLYLYLDRYADNSPVLDAQIEVESGDWKATAQADGEGYRVAATPFVPGARYPLIFTIVTADTADLLETTLEVPGRAAPAASASRWPWFAAGGAGLALLALTLTLIRRQRRSAR